MLWNEEEELAQETIWSVVDARIHLDSVVERLEV